jgi:hypothetical protein
MFAGAASAQQATTAAPPADAQNSPAALAQQHYRQGIELYEQQRFEEALNEFRAGQAQYPSPNIRLYIARCLRGLNRPDEASIEYGLTSHEARDRAMQDSRYAPTRDAADEELRALVPQIGRVRVIAPGLPEWAWIRVGGHVVRASDIALTTPVLPGEVLVEIEAHGYRRAEQRIQVSAGASQEVTIQLERDPSWDGQPPTATELAAEQARREGHPIEPPASSAPPIEVPPPPPVHTPPPWMRPLAYGVLGLGVASFAVVGVTGGLALSTYNGVNDRCRMVSCPANEQPNIDSGRTMQTVSNVFIGVGAAALVGGGLLWFFSRTPPRTTVGFTGNSLVVGGVF